MTHEKPEIDFPDSPPPSDLEPSDRLATTRVGKPPLRSASCKSSPGWRPTLPSSRKCLGRGDAPGSERSGGGIARIGAQSGAEGAQD